MAQMLDRMVKEGLLKRAADNADRRKVMFSMSQAAMNSMPHVKAQIAAGNGEIFAALGADGLKTLSTLLEKLELHLEREA
jgi:DNA-binding MarR family transcriptional regulator